MERYRRISRRTVLKGLGASLALPLLEVMRDPVAAAQSSRDKQPPLRMAFLYVPNGVHMPDWTPWAEGKGWLLPPILEPLQLVKDDLLVISGLTLNPARALGDGGGDHARAMASFLTGRHPRKTGFIGSKRHGAPFSDAERAGWAPSPWLRCSIRACWEPPRRPPRPIAGPASCDRCTFRLAPNA